MGIYEEMGELVDGVREALERAPGLLDKTQVLMEDGTGLMKTGASLMKRGASLMDRTTETLGKVDTLLTATTALVEQHAENAALEKQRLELEVARLSEKRALSR